MKMKLKYPDGFTTVRSGLVDILGALLFGQAELCHWQDRQAFCNACKIEIARLQALKDDSEYAGEPKFTKHHELANLIELVYVVGI